MHRVTAQTTEMPWTLYVTVSNPAGKLVPVDVTTRNPGVAITAGTIPYGVAITPDASKAYIVNNSTSVNSALPIDLITGVVGAAIPSVGLAPYNVAITPDGAKAYITGFFKSVLTPIDVATNAKLLTIPTGGFPYDVAITPDGSTAFVTNNGSDNVSVINLLTNQVGTPIPVGDTPFGMAITPDGTKAFVANNVGDSVTPIDVVTKTAGPPIPVGHYPYGVAITPDGKTVIVGNGATTGVNPPTSTYSLSFIDVATMTVRSTLPISSAPKEIAVTPDGLQAFVSSSPSAIVIPIDVVNEALGGSSIDLSSYGPTVGDLVVSPDQAPVAALSVASSSVEVGSSVDFDASASTVQFGSIAQYAWDFGDGKTLVTTMPTVSHVYDTAGNFTASVTLTSSGGTSTAKVFTGSTMARNGGPQAIASQEVDVAAAPTTSTTSLSLPTTTTLSTEVLGEVISSSAATATGPTLAFSGWSSKWVWVAAFLVGIGLSFSCIAVLVSRKLRSGNEIK